MKYKRSQLVFATIMIFFGSNHSKAQNNDVYYPFIQGREVAFFTYDSKDRIQYIRKSATLGVTKNDETWQATVKDVVSDKNGKEIFTFEYTLKTAQGSFFADLRSFITPEMLKSFKVENLRYDTRFVETGLKLAVGEKLKENTLNIAVLRKSEIDATIQVKLFNRKFESEEYLETSFGRLKCMKIIYDLVDIVTTQDIPNKTYHRVNEWYAPSMGLVKSVSYDKDGDLDTYTLLKEVKK